MGKAIFVTGTGTDIGKTYVTGLIVKKLRDAGSHAGYYKAALSGAELAEDGRLQPGDVLHVQKIAGISGGPRPVSYVYREAVSPHLAARWNKMPIDFARVREDFEAAKAHYDYLTMEGSGGIICPLRWDKEEKVILDDLVKDLKLSVLIVADAGLGTINAAVLTAEHLEKRQISVKGFIFNQWTGSPMEEDNRCMVEELTGIPVIACVSKGDTELLVDAEKLAALYE